jgi:hypothetical protein
MVSAESQAANNAPIHTIGSGSWLDGQACYIPAIPGHHLHIEKGTFGSMDVTMKVQALVQQQGGCSLLIAAGDSHNFTKHFGEPQPMVDAPPLVVIEKFGLRLVLPTYCDANELEYVCPVHRLTPDFQSETDDCNSESADELGEIEEL